MSPENYSNIPYNFKGVSNDSDSHKLFAVVAAIHHQGIRQSFDDGALCFPKSFDSVPAGGVRDVDGGADLNVVAVYWANCVS